LGQAHVLEVLILQMGMSLAIQYHVLEVLQVFVLEAIQ
jgi:hypothetical protein